MLVSGLRFHLRKFSLSNLNQDTKSCSRILEPRLPSYLPTLTSGFAQIQIHIFTSFAVGLPGDPDSECEDFAEIFDAFETTAPTVVLSFNITFFITK